MLSRLRAGLAVRRALVCVTLGVLLFGGVSLPAWSAPGHAADADPPAAEVETPAQDEPPSKDEPAEDEEPAEEPLEPKPDEPEPDEPEPDDEAPAQIGPQTVPPANGNNAVITVKVAGDRTSLTGVGPLAGVQLGFFYTETGDTAAFTCTSDADGDCSITVPNAHLTINQGGNRDRRFWVRQVGAAPGHYDNPSLGVGSTVSSTSYRFQTGNRLRAGGTYRSTDDFMIDTGTNNNTASSGIWQNSRSNPSFPAKCGINVALVLDLSGSVGSDLPNLKSAANTFVNSLSGTPSAVSVFTFATSAPAAGGSNGTLPLTSVSTPAGAATVTSKINGLALGTGNEAGTNWDRGLYQVAQSTARFDVAVVITDGNPTFYSAAEGPGDRTRFREVEHGVFSANAIKAEGTKVIAFGVGGGIGNTGSGQNLRAISGPTLNTDYYQTTDYQAAGEQLRALALGNCAGSITVVKQVVPSTTAPGSTTGATPQGGWTFTGAGSTGITFEAPNARDTAPITGAANFPLSFAGGTTTGPVTLTETLRDGYSLHQGVIGQNAVCRRLDTGANLAVTNAGSLGFTVGTSVDYSVSCTVYNRAADVDASVVLEKTWRVNGTTYADGDQPSALAATGSIDGTDEPFGQPRGGFAQGDTVSLDESLGRMPAQCTLDSSRLTSANGTAVDLPLPASRTLAAGSNAFEITNVVTCPTLLTLDKTVRHGPASPSEWTLDALAPDGALPGPVGVAGSPEATGVPVTPGVTYPLAESGGPLEYVQFTAPNAVLIAGATGSWNCQEVDRDGTTVLPGFADGLNGGVRVPFGSWVRCTAANETAMIRLVKEVSNDHGGTAAPSDWDLVATPTGAGSAGLPEIRVPGADLADAEILQVRPGVSYELSEEGGPDGYEIASIECEITQPRADAASVALAPGERATCWFVNEDRPAQLTLVKDVVNAHGGTAEATAWTLSAEGPTPVSGVTGSDDVTAAPVLPGDYDLSESGGPEGYTASGWDCGPAELDGSTVTVPLGADVTCTIVNTDQAAQLTLVKVVDNGDTGGTTEATAWTLSADGPTPISGATGSDEVTAATVDAGSYELAEEGPAGYRASDWDCGLAELDDETVRVPNGGNVTCTITNTAVAPTLTLVKEVVNEHGGTAVPTEWTLTADGPSPISGITGSDEVTGVVVQTGDYDLSEAGPTGYTASDWDCGPAELDGSTVSVPLDEDVTCTIVNADQPARLTLVKVVDNGDTGDTAVPADFTLTAEPQGIDGQPTVSGHGDPDLPGGVNEEVVFSGDYLLSEDGPDGFEGSIWECTGGVVDGETVRVPNGGNVTCTITNTAVAPTLTLVKEVVNEHGGTAVPTEWTLTADGPSPISGITGSDEVTGVVVQTGDYDLSEAGPTGYTASDWDCGPAELDGSTVSVPLDEDVTCTIVNADQPARLTLVKVVDNGDTGDTAVPADFTLTAEPQGIDGQPTVSGHGDPDLPGGVNEEVVFSGDYLLSEDGPDGFEGSIWECTGGVVDGETVRVPNGGNVTCTITNTAVAPTLTLVKEVVNEHGGTAVPTEWTLTADGPSPISGATGDASVTSAPVQIGDYDLSEAGPSGYTASDWDCGPAELDGSTVTVPLGEDVTCTIVNTDGPALLTLVKVVDAKDSGTTKVPSDFTLTAEPQGIDGQPTVSGHGDPDLPGGVNEEVVFSGDYLLSEDGPDGFEGSIWECTGGVVDGETVRVPNGGNVTCTITNTAVAPTLTLVKEVVNEHGGTAVPTEWTLTADGPSPISGATGDASVTSAPVQIGDYDLSEAGPSGYTASDWDCGPAELDGSTVTVPLGEDVTCTIVNTDGPALLTLVKVVDAKDSGTTKVPSDFTLTAEPQGIDGQPTVSGHGDPDLPGGVNEEVVFSGDYLLSEDGPDGFEGSIWECTGGVVDGETVTVPNGGNVTCTITNTAVAPTLTLVKEVVNEHGGTAVPTEWTLTADGPSPISGATGDASVTSAPVQIGDYDLSEAGPSGYTASDWDCGPAELDGSTVTVPLGEDVTCTIVNTDGPALLTLVKVVDAKDSGTTKVPSDFTLTAEPQGIDGQPTVSGHGDPDLPGGVNEEVVFSGDYLLSEDGPDGFEGSIWECTGGVVDGATVTVPNGGDVTCTITNTAVVPTLTLVKQVDDPEQLGTAVPADWTLSAAGPSPISGKTGDASVTAAPVKVGDYTLSEAGPTDYTASAWSCVDADGAVAAPGGVVNLREGDDVTCTIVNRPVPPAWSVLKQSDPESGSTVEPGDEITYRVSLIRGTGVDPRNVTVTDDLSDVLNYATLVDGPTTTPASFGTASIDDDTLTWTVPVLDEPTAYVEYTVRVDDDAWGVTLRNVVTSPGSTTCPPPEGESARAAGALLGPATLAGVLSNAEDDQCSTTHPTPAWELEKSSDPASGSTVQPGSKVTYTLWVTNTSDAIVANAVVTDDLSDVLKHARLDAVPDGVTLKKKTLTWEVPELDTGESVSLSYTVTVDKDAHDVSFGNVATPGDGGECPEVCTTTHETPPEPVDPTPPTTPAPPSPWLPNTGGPGLLVLMLGGGLLVLGSGLVYAARRRRQVVVPE